jgi:hypothetical protein
MYAEVMRMGDYMYLFLVQLTYLLQLNKDRSRDGFTKSEKGEASGAAREDGGGGCQTHPSYPDVYLSSKISINT